MVDMNMLNILHIGEHEFPLLYVDPTTMAKTFTIVIPCEIEDLNDTLKVFEEIDKIEIYESDNVTLNKSLSTYDTHTGNIDILKNSYVDMEGNPICAVRLVLKETDYEVMVKKLNQQINPTIDYSSMSIEEYRELFIEEFGKICTATIYAGVDVETEYGVEHFSATEADQRNIKDLCDIAILAKQGFTYHADDTQCKVYSAKDIIKIYIAIKSLVLYQTTYCNALNTYVRSLHNKNEISVIEYGMSIPNEMIQKEMEEAIAYGQSVIEALAGIYLAEPEEELPEEPVEPEVPDVEEPETENEEVEKVEGEVVDEEDVEAAE